MRDPRRAVLHQRTSTRCTDGVSAGESWIDDPAGISWETFLTTGEATDYGNPRRQDVRVAQAACCEGART